MNILKSGSPCYKMKNSIHLVKLLSNDIQKLQKWWTEDLNSQWPNKKFNKMIKGFQKPNTLYSRSEIKCRNKNKCFLLKKPFTPQIFFNTRQQTILTKMDNSHSIVFVSNNPRGKFLMNTCQHAHKHVCGASKNSTDCTGLGSRMEKLKYLHICVHYQVEVSFSAFVRGKSSSCVDLFTPLIFIVWTKHFSDCQNFNLWVN